MILEYGKIFKTIRINKNMSAKEVSILSNISNSYLSEFENLKKSLPFETLSILFKTIGIDFVEFSELN
ncbi:MAG: helix-turn-helix transcriptional regulator, partial [Longicatena sp.]